MALLAYTEKNCKNCKCDCFNAGLDDVEICTEYHQPGGYEGIKKTKLSYRLHGEKGNSTMKLKWFIATFRDTTTNKWRDVNIQADSLREARYKALTYHKGTFEVLERIEEK